jgi:hypothetical protein
MRYNPRVALLQTDLRDPGAPLPLQRWQQLWAGDGSPNVSAWEGLEGPPGNANGDTYPTRPGDRTHPATTAAVEVDDSSEVLVLVSPAVMASDARASELATRWFEPGTITAGRHPGGIYTPRHAAIGGARVTGATRPATTAAAALGALVLYRDGAAWRPAVVSSLGSP